MSNVVGVFILVIMTGNPPGSFRLQVWGPTVARRIVQDVNVSRTSTVRRKLSLEARILQVVAVFLTAVGMFWCLMELPGNWCPSNSFYGRALHVDYLPFMAAGLLALFTLGASPLLAAMADRSLWWGPTSLSRPARRNFAITVCAFTCGSIISSYLYIRSISSYYCLTPDDIVVRTSYLDEVHNYRWNAVKEVHGICWTHDWKREHFLGGSVNLELEGGIELPVNLRADNGTVSPNYRMVKAALAGKAYQYYVNATVTPTACPPNLYPLLWNWPRDEGGRPESFNRIEFRLGSLACSFEQIGRRPKSVGLRRVTP